MLRLKLSNAPEQVEILPGVVLTVAPVRSSVLQEARRDLRESIEADAEADTDSRRLALKQFDALVRMVARYTILDWTGVVDDQDQPCPVTPELVDALMEDDRAFLAFRDKVVSPAVLVFEEGNG